MAVCLAANRDTASSSARVTRGQRVQYPVWLFFLANTRDILLDASECAGTGVALALAGREMQPVVKGMVQVHSVTYRIVRVRAGQYDVVRLLDDVRVGGFSLGMRREAIIEGDAPEVIREVARAALQGGRTTWAPRRLLA